MDKFTVSINLSVESTNSQKELEEFYRELLSDYQGTQYQSKIVSIEVKKD